VWTLPVRSGSKGGSAARPVLWRGDSSDGDSAASRVLGTDVRRVTLPVAIVRSSYYRRCTGRSTNGRSRDFESLCLGSNPSRPTTKSTPEANRKFRVISRQQIAAEV